MSKWVAFIPVLRDIIYKYATQEAGFKGLNIKGSFISSHSTNAFYPQIQWLNQRSRQIYLTNILYAPFPMCFWHTHTLMVGTFSGSCISPRYKHFRVLWVSKQSRYFPQLWMMNEEYFQQDLSFVLPVSPEIAFIDLKLYHLTFPHDC